MNLGVPRPAQTLTGLHPRQLTVLKVRLAQETKSQGDHGQPQNGANQLPGNGRRPDEQTVSDGRHPEQRPPDGHQGQRGGHRGHRVHGGLGKDEETEGGEGERDVDANEGPGIEGEIGTVVCDGFGELGEGEVADYAVCC